MLDQVRKTLAPATLRAEREKIESDLATLELQREEARLNYGRLRQEVSCGGPSAPMEAAAKAAYARLADLNSQVKARRARRRELIELLAPGVVRERLIGVEKPQALRDVESALEQAREEKQAQIARHFQRKDRDAKAAELNAAVAILESEISALRLKRAELLEPYHAAVREILRPMEVEQAEKLERAARDFLEAVSMLAEIASEKPPIMPGYGNGLEHLATLSTLPAHQALAFTARILGAPTR